MVKYGCLLILVFSFLFTSLHAQSIPDTVIYGQGFELTFGPPEGFTPEYVLFCYRLGGEEDYTIVEIFVNGNGEYEAEVPPEAVNEQGIEYYVSFFDREQTATFPDVPDAANNPIELTVTLNSFSGSFFALRPGVYRMISVPIDLDDSSVAGLLGDDYALYNPEELRLFIYSAADESYLEYGDESFQDGFERGSAYWLITRDGTPFDIEGRSTDTDLPYSMTLPSGWSQFANPFPFAIPWSNVAVVNGQQTDLQQPQHYDGLVYDTVSVLRPWEGYFVFNRSSSDLEVQISPDGNFINDGGTLAKPVMRPDFEYRLNLSASLKGSPAVDTRNVIGFSASAKPGIDNIDLREPPHISEQFRLSLVESDTRMMSSIKPNVGEGGVWDMEVFIPRTYLQADVELISEGDLPEGFSVYVLDKENFKIVDTGRGSFTVSVSGDADITRNYSVIVGSAAFAEANSGGIPLVPIAYQLGRNFPNPFNPETQIPYQLNQRGPVQLEIYNLLGQRVRTLVNRVQNTGSHTVTWNGQDDAGRQLASGVYMYRMAASDFVATKKLILIR